MAKRMVWEFDFWKPHLRVWAESYRLLGGKCPLCGCPVRIPRKLVEEALSKDGILECLEFWIRRYERLRKVRKDLDEGKFRSVVEVVNAIKKALDRPVKSIYGFPSAGCYPVTYTCPECGERYPIKVHFTVVSKIFISPESMFSWYELYQKFEDLGDKRLNYQLKKHFGLMYRDLRQEIFKRCREGDYGLLIDVSLFLKRRLGLVPNLYLPPIRMTAEKEEEIRKFWNGFDLSSATFVPPPKK